MGKEIKNISELIEVVKAIDPMSVRDVQHCLIQISEIVDDISTKVFKNVEIAIQEKDFELGHTLLDTVQDIKTFQSKLELQIDALDVSMGEFDTYEDEQNLAPKDETQLEMALDAIPWVGTNDSYDNAVPNVEPHYAKNIRGHALNKNFAHEKPTAFSLLGTKVAAKSWKDVFFKTCDILVERNYDEIYALATEDAIRGSKMVYISTKPKDMRKPKKLTNHEIYIETALDSNYVRDLVMKLLKICFIPIQEYRIYLKSDYKKMQ